MMQYRAFKINRILKSESMRWLANLYYEFLMYFWALQQNNQIE